MINGIRPVANTFAAIAILSVATAVLSACSGGGRETSQGDSSSPATSIGEVGLTVPAPPDYDRSAFSADWDDADGDCLNTRMEILAEWSSSPVRYDEGGCRIVSGRCISEYTDETIYDASEIDIDHVVPLSCAWQQGAYEWSPAKRANFFNDAANLLPVELSLNRAKGDRPPNEWLPPKNKCRYVSRFKRVGLLPKKWAAI